MTPGEKDALRRERWRQIGGFAISGGLAFVVDAGVLSLGVSVLGWPAELARVPSFLAAVVTTWLLNRRYTFRTARPPGIGEFLAYLSAMAAGLAVNYAVFVAVLRWSDLAAGMPVLALVPATLAGMVVNFVTARRILGR